jgi:hypothetical protein
MARIVIQKCGELLPRNRIRSSFSGAKGCGEVVDQGLARLSDFRFFNELIQSTPHVAPWQPKPGRQLERILCEARYMHTATSLQFLEVN